MRNSFLIILYFLSSSILGPLAFASSPILACQDILISTSNVEFTIQQEYVHTDEIIKSNIIIFLSSDEYLNATKNETIPVSAILVLDELPLSDDLPLVAAVIFSKRLLLEATHIQVLAEKIGIALIFNEEAYTNSELRNLAKNNHSFKMICKESKCQISASQEAQTLKPKMESILPKNFDRDKKDLYTLSKELQNFPQAPRVPRELSGDKYFELMSFKIAFPHLVADISSLSSGFFNYFLRTSISGEQLLISKYQLLNYELKKANAANNEIVIKKILKDFRKAILTSQTIHPDHSVFKEIGFYLQSYYHELYKNNISAFSIRSNQDVEDLIGSGLYRSTITPNLSTENIESSIRLIWASLYDYRAYTIRRYWGQKENNLTMPLLVHPYVDQTLFHSLGTFRWNPHTGLELDLNMVMGTTEKATNPNANAQVIQLAISGNEGDLPQIKFKPPNGKTKSLDKPNLSPTIEMALLRFYVEVYSYLKNEFLFRTYPPNAVNIELVAQENPLAKENPKILVLQYKPSLSRELTLDLLSGLLSREDTDKKKSNLGFLATTETLIKESLAKPLSELDPDLLTQNNNTAGGHVLRYALLVKERKPLLIFWSASIFHTNMKLNFDGSELKWLKSGYLKLQTDVRTNKLQLIFSEPNLETKTDEELLLIVSQQIFQDAFNAALNENRRLQKVLADLQPEIIFQTLEGSGQLSLPEY